MTKYTAILVVDCTAPDDLFFKDYPKGVSKETLQAVDELQPSGVPCEGTRSLSDNCLSCPWCEELEWEWLGEVEDQED